MKKMHADETRDANINVYRNVSDPIGVSWLFSKRLILDLIYVRICWYQLYLFVRTHLSVRLNLHEK